MTQSVPSILRPAPRRSSAADAIDYAVQGQEMQFVELELDPGESAIAEAGAMMFKPPSITMDTVFGDGSKPDSGFLGKIAAAGKRLLTGENLFVTVFSNSGPGKARIAFAAPYPGTIVPFHLGEGGGTLIAQKDAFLCAAKGVSIGIHFQRKIGAGLFGGAGFIMQKFEGDGWVFLHGGGMIIERTLGAGETLHVDTGCIVAIEPSVDFDIVKAGGVKSMIFGGEGFFFAEVKGPGRVWLQSLPFSRLAGRINAAVPSRVSMGSDLTGSSWTWGSNSDSGDTGGGDSGGGDGGGN
jgi:uncharacterized protein (TIGR00266 family)